MKKKYFVRRITYIEGPRWAVLNRYHWDVCFCWSETQAKRMCRLLNAQKPAPRAER